MTDKEIIALLNEGDSQKAFEELVHSYSERLYWHIRHLVQNHDDADDLVQEVFVKVWTSLPSFRGDSQIFTWLWRIATNEAINFLRKQKIRAMVTFDDFEDAMSRKIDNDAYFDGNEAQRLLMKAVTRLPSRQQTIFIMRWFEELKNDEIAQILGLSTGAVKASYHFACEKLKSELKDNFVVYEN